MTSSSLGSVTAWKVARLSHPKPTIGKIAKTVDGIIYLTLGAKNGVIQGQKLNVYRNQGDIVDPDTRKVIASERPRIAQLEVIEVQDTYSKSKLLGSNEVRFRPAMKSRRSRCEWRSRCSFGGRRLFRDRGWAGHFRGAEQCACGQAHHRGRARDALRRDQGTGDSENGILRRSEHAEARPAAWRVDDSDGKDHRRRHRHKGIHSHVQLETGEVVLAVSQNVAGGNKAAVSPSRGADAPARRFVGPEPRCSSGRIRDL